MDKMEFTLGNTQDEAPRRVEKKPVNKKLLFGILAAVVLIAVLAAVLWDPNSFDGLRRRVIYAQAQKDENGCARLYDYAADRTSAYASLDGSLLIASAGQLRLVGENGSVRYETGLRFQGCAVARGGKTAAVYDVGGTEVYVLDSAGLVRQFEVPGPLFSLTVNEKDYIAATFNGSGYKGTVTVYDDKGAEVFTYHSAERFVFSAAVSPDARSVTAVTLGQAGGSFASRLVTYRLNATEPENVTELTGSAVLDVGGMGRGFCAVAEDALHFLSASGAEEAVYGFSGDSLRRCDLGGDGFAAVLLGHYRSGSQCRLVTVDGEGRELASLEVNSDVLDLSVRGRYVAVLFSDRLTIYDKHLTPCATLDDVSSVRQVMVRADGSAVLAGISDASLYLP